MQRTVPFTVISHAFGSRQLPNLTVPNSCLLVLLNTEKFYVTAHKSRNAFSTSRNVCVAKFWTVETLKYHLKSNLHGKQGELTSNFKKTIADTNLQKRALLSFKDEYLLFFNRRLQSLVAIELKRCDFKPEYAGKLNFYLSVLDEYVKLTYENPSIGIILCKSRSKTTVEFAFRDTSKPMGVATYRLDSELPAKYQDILPDAKTLENIFLNFKEQDKSDETLTVEGNDEQTESNRN